MAKKSQPKAHSASPESPTFQEAAASFARGDFGRARVLLEGVVLEPGLPEGARATARDWLDATRTDRVVLGVAAACATLLGLVALVTSLLQP